MVLLTAVPRLGDSRLGSCQEYLRFFTIAGEQRDSRFHNWLQLCAFNFKGRCKSCAEVPFKNSRHVDRWLHIGKHNRKPVGADARNI